MDYFSREISVLSRSVAYQNLSGAAAHVGLSQPQLSRIVAKLESELGMRLLDRASRRKSAWTPAAFRLAEAYADAQRRFQADLGKLVKDGEPTHARVGSLEGLTGIAIQFCHQLTKSTSIQVIELDVFDLNDLEETFYKRGLDFVFTFREPGRRKHRYLKTLGHQTLEHIREGDGGVHVMSSFEYGASAAARTKSPARHLVSNSLEVRRTWLSKFGGTGIVPSDVRTSPAGKAGVTKSDVVPALLIGSEELPETFWAKVTQKFKPS